VRADLALSFLGKRSRAFSQLASAAGFGGFSKRPREIPMCRKTTFPPVAASLQVENSDLLARQ
jgi:hypothetical protein